MLPKETIKKLEGKKSESIIIGYRKSTKGYNLWDVNSKKVAISRDVLFEEVKQATDICGLEDKSDHKDHDETQVLRNDDSEEVDEHQFASDGAELDDCPVNSYQDGRAGV